MKNFYGFILMILGIFIGAAFFSSLRTSYYIYYGIKPNMAPQIFIVFSPVLAIIISIFVSIVHIILKNYLVFDKYWKWFLSGVSYSSVLLGLISPWLLIIPVFINPISAKLIIRYSLN